MTKRLVTERELYTCWNYFLYVCYAPAETNHDQKEKVLDGVLILHSLEYVSQNKPFALFFFVFFKTSCELLDKSNGFSRAEVS